MISVTLLMVIGGFLGLVVIIVLAVWWSRNESVLKVPTAASEQLQSLPIVYTMPELAALAEAGKLVQVNHPLVLRSMEQALERGGPMTRYIVRYQDALWLTFEALPDAQEREQAYELFRRFNTGEDLDIRALMQVMRKIGR